MQEILIIEDHFVTAIGMEMIIKQNFEGISVDITSDGKQGLEKLHQQNYQLLILDLFLPETDTHALVYKIKKLYPNLKILVYSSGPEKIYGSIYKTLGANGYLSKNDGAEVIVLAIKVVLSNRVFFDIDAQKNSSILKDGESGNPFNSLSVRETEVLSHLLQGKAVGTIANDLHLQVSSISTMKMRIFKKLNVTNTIDCARLALSLNYSMANIGSNKLLKNE